MSGLEKQIGAIADKAALKAYIEEMPDDVRGVILTEAPAENPDCENECELHYIVQYRTIGDVTPAECIYLVRSYEHWVFGDME